MFLINITLKKSVVFLSANIANFFCVSLEYSVLFMCFPVLRQFVYTYVQDYIALKRNIPVGKHIIR